MCFLSEEKQIASQIVQSYVEGLPPLACCSGWLLAWNDWCYKNDKEDQMMPFVQRMLSLAHPKFVDLVVPFSQEEYRLYTRRALWGDHAFLFRVHHEVLNLLTSNWSQRNENALSLADAQTLDLIRDEAKREYPPEKWGMPAPVGSERAKADLIKCIINPSYMVEFNDGLV
eukprot:TRINITY_DN67197_c3_g9_i1.p1 TRINITY_DN67197_c3_g9~~TRINITY_DN67197_c3_g9_i1.p1  ORF type:complete len:171 (-),score=15.75 TRINITY_DN67197_c3_g9_i1:213-725(-)